MSTTTKAESHRKSERRIRIIKPVQEGFMGAIQIVIDGEAHNYLILPMASDFGAAFRLIKQELVPIDPGMWELKDTAAYNVCLDGKQSSCECLGFLHRGRCKHISGLAVLRQRNLI